jgi:hypothetical protein
MIDAGMGRDEGVELARWSQFAYHGRDHQHVVVAELLDEVEASVDTARMD